MTAAGGPTRSTRSRSQASSRSQTTRRRTPSTGTEATRKAARTVQDPVAAAQKQTRTTTQEPATTARRRTAQGHQEQAEREQKPRTATLQLPFVTAEFRMPRVPLPRLPLPPLRMPRVSSEEVAGAVNTVRSMLPSPQRAAYYAGLGVAAALEVIEWPVAVAVGAGTALASRGIARKRGETEEGATAGTARSTRRN
ncbi:MAG TPA: hypothetical protein VIL00_15925 [Pseudonocardiaceae bacterium]